MIFQTSDRVSLYYEIEGRGPALLFLHGNRQNAAAFDKQLQYFSHGYTLISMDSRGHGRSDHGDLPLTLDLLSSDVHDLLDFLAIRPLCIIGFSDGANIALKVAIQWPELAQKLVLISPNVHPSGLRTWLKLPFTLTARLLKPLAHWRGIQKYRELLSLMIDEQSFEWEALANIQTPSLLMGSQYDLIHLRHFKSLENALPQAKGFYLPGAGHMRLKTAHQLINAVIEEHIKTEL